MTTRQTQSTGRGGRGAKNNGRNQFKSAKSVKKAVKCEMKFHPHGEKKDTSHYCNFEEVRDALCRSLAKKKLYYPEDVIDSVCNMELLDLNTEEPQQLFSAEQNSQDRADQNAAYAKKYEIEYKEWKHRKQYFAANVLNLNATVIEYCSQKMQDKLVKEPDYYKTVLSRSLVEREQWLGSVSKERALVRRGLLRQRRLMYDLTHRGASSSSGRPNP